MIAMASQITSVSIVYSTVCSGADQRKHQSSASLAYVRGIHRWPVNSPHKGSVTRIMFPFDDVIMFWWPCVVTWALWRLRSLPLDRVVNSILTTRNIPKLCMTGSFWGESTGGWWFPLTKGKQCVKRFILWRHYENYQMKWTYLCRCWWLYDYVRYSGIVQRFLVRKLPIVFTGLWL